MSIKKTIFLIVRIIIISSILFVINFYTEQHLRFIYLNKIEDPFDGFLSGVLLLLNLPLFIIIEGEKLVQVDKDIFFYMMIFDSIAYGIIFGLITSRNNLRNDSDGKPSAPKK